MRPLSLSPDLFSPLLSSDTDTGSTGDTSTTGDAGDQRSQSDQTDNRRDADHDDDEPLGEGGKQALKREREARKSAEAKLRDYEARIKSIEDAERQRKEAEAKEQGKYQELLEAREKELNDLRAEVEREKLTRLRETHGRKAGLPEALWSRIAGDDEASIEADAKEMAKHLKAADAPDIDAGQRKARGTTKSEATSYTFGTRQI